MHREHASVPDIERQLTPKEVDLKIIKLSSELDIIEKEIESILEEVSFLRDLLQSDSEFHAEVPSVHLHAKSDNGVEVQIPDTREYVGYLENLFSRLSKMQSEMEITLRFLVERRIFRNAPEA